MRPMKFRPRAAAIASAALVVGCQSNIDVFDTFDADAEADGGVLSPGTFADKVDLLFVVDNSASMADKQQVLAWAVPELVSRLTNPRCLAVGSGAFVSQEQSPQAFCPEGAAREFRPVTDMHVGVITTSLGGHGADSCSNVTTVSYNPHMEDMAHFVTRAPAGGTVATWLGKGFLDWDPGSTHSPAGQSNAAVLTSSFEELVLGAGEDGCGFEAPLEAWYRFLVDPAPYASMAPSPCFAGDSSNQCRQRQGLDALVLQQRDDFLRQDSLVAVVMLSDENDCSVTDEAGQAYLALQALEGANSFHLPRGTAVCELDPNNPACKSCADVSSQGRPECQAGWPDPDLDDALNLRCMRQKQRFGVDFLYPLDRYVSAMTLPSLSGGAVSPLFCRHPSADGTSCTEPLRDKSLVVLAGIVGVPWQDLARDPRDLSKGLVPPSKVPWALVLGNIGMNVEPEDPLMAESVEPREGKNPPTGSTLATPATPPGTTGANPINGFERAIDYRNDLQYACIFDLPQPVDCAVPSKQQSCDCVDAPENPLCWDVATKSFGTRQYRAKAYPGRRQLAVLQGVGAQAVVASICPSNTSDAQAADYGYRPFVQAFVERAAWNLAAPSR